MQPGKATPLSIRQHIDEGVEVPRSSNVFWRDKTSSVGGRWGK